MNQREVADRLRDHGIEARDLDEWVLEHCQHTASGINHQGMETQVAYLLERGESAATILGAYGFSPNGNAVAELEGALAHCNEVLRQLSVHPTLVGALQFAAGGAGREALRRADRVLRERARQRRTPGATAMRPPEG